MSTPDPTGPDPRRRELLDAALGVFVRFGYRKTSMDELARAAGLSRQGLYLHFASKEDLFRATVAHFYGESLRDALAALRDETCGLEARLGRAFDAWIGRYAGMIDAASDLGEATARLVGPVAAEHEARFLDALAGALERAGLAAAYEPARLDARQLAATLHATARGLKYQSDSPAAFAAGMAIAVRALCAPLGGTP